jgi:hypothetical protein
MIIDESRREFVAKIVADLGKTLFGIGLASYFFEKFPIVLRVALSITWPLLLVSSVLIHPRKKGADGRC